MMCRAASSERGIAIQEIRLLKIKNISKQMLLLLLLLLWLLLLLVFVVVVVGVGGGPVRSLRRPFYN
jgi:hypothetical protein